MGELRRLFPFLTLEEEENELRLLVLGIRNGAGLSMIDEERVEYAERLVWRAARPEIEQKMQTALDEASEELKRIL